MFLKFYFIMFKKNKCIYLNEDLNKEATFA